MKIFSLFLYSLVIGILNTSHAIGVSTEKLEVLFTIDKEEGVYPRNPIELYSNGKGCFIWTKDYLFHPSKIDDEWIQSVENCYYSDMKLGGKDIYLTKIITDSLEELGFLPTWTKNLDAYSAKLWGSEFFSNYDISLKCFDESRIQPKLMDSFGNVLVLFSHFGPKNYEYGNYPKKLGVWHKDHGFKYLPVQGIEYIKRVFWEQDQLIVLGVGESETNEKIVVLSIKNGFWEEKAK